ncbi:uncharacterized protein F5147DRAFT_654624 [Suillus discolor]|uniref:RING-type domain-containing protein n=1 Tax=Suillus discolor TaxID=1912936 RepID=A0A9P7F420_9AGAM|nr:uncharacterized protein F5147DRAFT_654624 [Suillus discolor]KAG2103707.1 hypothetical protein F5147DRAFT_654624 [Suillus discolor]
MSSGPVRNAPRCRRAQTPFYHAAARPGPTTSRFRVAPALPHDVIEITINEEIPIHPHCKPAPAVHAEASVKILFNDEAAEQAGDVASTSNTSSADADATKAELASLRAVIQKVLSERDLSLECPICKTVFRELHTLKCGHSFCGACLKQWFQCCWSKWVADSDNPVPAALSLRDISKLPLSLAVISVVTKHIGPMPFTCPTCRGSVGRQEPFKTIALCQISNSITSLLGGACGEEDLPTNWTGYFLDVALAWNLIGGVDSPKHQMIQYSDNKIKSEGYQLVHCSADQTSRRLSAVHKSCIFCKTAQPLS